MENAEFIGYKDSGSTCLVAEWKCNKCEAIFTDDKPHTCNLNTFYADIVATGAHKSRLSGITVTVLELRIARSGERIKGKAHKGVTIAKVTSGSGYPQWMQRAKSRINSEQPETALAAQMIASIERERKQ